MNLEAYNKIKYFPYTYGLMHLLIDATTVMVIFSCIGLYELVTYKAFYLVVFYDLLAFAGQPFFGLITDKFDAARSTILVSIVVCVGSLIFLPINPVAAMIFAGAGNALFHVGAGALSLFVRPGHATPPGIFVAPGAIGLGLGIWLGKGGFMVIWPFYVFLAVSFIYALFSSDPKIPYKQMPEKLGVNKPMLAVFLLLFSIFIRAIGGYAGGYKCPKTTLVAFSFAFIACAGKGLGGIISDRFGWIQTSVIALVISAPLLAFNGGNVMIALIGLLIFQMTMPVTLVAVVSVFPRRPAFAFGLTCVALVFGGILTFYHQIRAYYSSFAILITVLLAALAVYYGLYLLKDKVTMKFPAKVIG